MDGTCSEDLSKKAVVKKLDQKKPLERVEKLCKKRRNNRKKMYKDSACSV
jgi:hypothetical protein